VRLERSRWVVQEDACRTEVGQLLRLLDQLLLGGRARAVDEARLELPVCGRDRLARLTEIRNVVQWILETENIDSALGRAGHEPSSEVAADRPRADQEPASQGHPERRLRPRLERTDPLPGALDSAAHRGVEDATTGDLQVGKAGVVEKLRQPEEIS
jgi:hypothetical protein